MERGVNPQLWWYLSRSAGIVAWVMLTGSVLWGIVLASDLFPTGAAAPGCWRCIAGWPG